MQNERRGTSKAHAGSTRLLSTEELFEGFNELYESAESEGEAAVASAVSAPATATESVQATQASHLEITESGDAINVRAELRSFDSADPTASAPRVKTRGQTPGVRAPRKTHKKANPVLRAIDLLADADRENTMATLKGGMLEVKMPKGRVESLAAARSAVLASVVRGRPQGA